MRANPGFTERRSEKMNRWHRLLAAGVVAMAVASGAVLAPVAAHAAPAKPAKAGKAPGGMKKLENALAQVNLTDEQKPKVKEAMSAAAADMKKVEGDKKAMRPIRADLMKKLNGILTAEQSAKFKELVGAKKPKK